MTERGFMSQTLMGRDSRACCPNRRKLFCSEGRATRVPGFPGKVEEIWDSRSSSLRKVDLGNTPSKQVQQGRAKIARRFGGEPRCRSEASPARAACLTLIFFVVFCCVPFAVSPATAASPVFDVREFHAAGDGRTKDTAAITSAIAAAAKAGGGMVHFPPGKYLTGAIHFKSRVALDLDAGATILFSTDPADYPLVRTRWESTDCYNFSPLIYGYGLEHIAITGQGTLDGQGKAWHGWQGAHSEKTIERLREMGEQNTPLEQRKFGTVADGLRPQMIQFFACRDVRIEGVTVTGAPFWTIHPAYCTNVVIRGVTIDTTGPNTDGIDPESSRDVLIENCKLSTGDDCIAIKSGRDADGRRVGIPCENITVQNCQMGHGHGGVAVGSEMSGGVRHVRVSHCTMNGTDNAIRIKTMRGRGGVVEDVVITDLKLTDIKKNAFEITMFYKQTPDEPLSERTPALRDIHLSDVTCDGAGSAFTLRGLTERPVENVTVKNLKISATKGGVCHTAKNVRFENAAITVKSGEPMKFENCTDCFLDGKPQ